MSKVSAAEKTVTVAGIILIAVGCVANVYSAYVNQRFIHDPFIDPLYYFRYVILLLGGFAAGYLLTKKEKSFKVTNGVFYALLAIVLYFAFDIVRFLIRWLFGMLPFPGEKILLEGASLFAVLATFLVAYFAQFRPKFQSFASVSKKIFIGAFLAHQLHLISTSIYFHSNETPFWIQIFSYLTMPIVIAVIAYPLLNTKKLLERIFYASLVGVFYEGLSTVLWEFRTDASSDSTMIFSYAALALALACTGVLIWRLRQSLRSAR